MRGILAGMLEGLARMLRGSEARSWDRQKVKAMPTCLDNGKPLGPCGHSIHCHTGRGYDACVFGRRVEIDGLYYEYCQHGNRMQVM